MKAVYSAGSILYLQYGAQQREAAGTRVLVDGALPHTARFHDVNVRHGLDGSDLVGRLLQSAEAVMRDAELKSLQAVHHVPSEPETLFRAGAERCAWRAACATTYRHGLICDEPTAPIAEFSNRVGALVASSHGAIPDHTPDALFDV